MDSKLKNKLFYSKTPDAPLLMQEFGFYSLDKWKKQGYIDDNTDLNRLFGFDSPSVHSIWDLGWCEAPLFPPFEEKILEIKGEHEIVRDYAGRTLVCFKGRRNGFMPEYIDHPVKDIKTFEENIEWRLSPSSPERIEYEKQSLKSACEAKEKGLTITQRLIGGYMYLRSLIGPEKLLYAFYDDPKLIHRCMQSWFEVADNAIARKQAVIPLDELFIAEDICYNTSSLISNDMIKEFLFPYYKELIHNMRERQSSPFHLQVDTDGRIECVIPLYMEIGFDYFSPFEAASGSDVVAIGEKYPDILISGGFDKRILSKGKEAIDREIDRIMPAMKKRGGYIPTCDHGVPEEVEFENYLHFRNRLSEFAR